MEKHPRGLTIMAAVHFAYALAMLAGILSAFLVYVLSPEFSQAYETVPGFWLPLVVLFSPRLLLFLPAFAMFVVSGVGFLKRSRRSGLICGMVLCVLWFMHTAVFVTVIGYHNLLWYAPLMIYLAAAAYLLIKRYRPFFTKTKPSGAGRSKIRKFAGALPHAALLFLFVSTTLISMAMITLGRDAPSPDTSDLVTQRAKIADEQNAFTSFAEAAEVVYELEDREDYQVARDYIAGKDVGDEGKEIVRVMLEKNRPTFEKIREGLERETLQIPAGLHEPSFTYDFMPVFRMRYLTHWRALGRVMRVKGRHEQLEGQYEEAVGTCFMLLRFSEMIRKDAPEILLHYLIGNAIADIGHELVHDISRDPDIPAGKIERVAEYLAELGPYDKAISRSITGEYRLFFQRMDENREFVWGPEKLFTFPTDRRNLQNMYFFLQPNATRAKMAEIMREMKNYISKPYSEIHLEPQKSESLFSTLLKPNIVGRYSVTDTRASLQRLLQQNIKADAKLKGTRLIVACNLYRRATGRLPENLKSLVPEYLNAVPIDPYYGEPFRYSRTKAVAYSVGENLEDSGGTKDEDIVFEINKRNEENDNKNP